MSFVLNDVSIQQMSFLDSFHTLTEELVAEKNVQLVTTNLTGREAQDIAADFESNEEGTKVEKCAGGFEPKSCSYNPQTGQCTVFFHCTQCDQCPHKDQCRPKTFKRICQKTISANTKWHAGQQRYRGQRNLRHCPISETG